MQKKNSGITPHHQAHPLWEKIIEVSPLSKGQWELIFYFGIFPRRWNIRTFAKEGKVSGVISAILRNANLTRLGIPTFHWYRVSGYLKPGNLLFDQKGYLKITDFGFAKKIDDGKTRTLVCTSEYLASEVLRNESYSFSCDWWWSFGILLFEMCNGTPPFTSGDSLRIFEKIWQDKVKYPDFFGS